VQSRKRKHTKKSKKKNSSHRSKKEPFGYQPDNPITIYYAKYIGEWKKAKIK